MPRKKSDPPFNEYYSQPRLMPFSQKMDIEAFDPNTGEWDYYSQRLMLFLDATDLDDDQKRDLFLMKIGPDAFKVLVDHFRPNPVNTLSLSSLMSVLDNFYTRSYCIFAERVEFARRYRQEGESAREYIHNLRQIAGKCGFGVNLDERLRDQVIVGIHNHMWQKELLKLSPNSKLSDVEKIVYNLENIDLGQAKIVNKNNPNEDTINNIGKGTKTGRKQPTKKLTLIRGKHCFKCGKILHKSGMVCPAEGKICSACGNENHFARVCVKTGKAEIVAMPNRVRERSQSSESGNSSDVANVCSLENSKSKIMLSVILNKKRIKMLYDPGASKTVISQKIWKKLGSPDLDYTPDLIAYTGVPVHTLGQTSVTVKAFNKSLILPIIVVEKHDVPLFGLDWVLAFKLPLPPGAKICNTSQKKLTLKNSKPNKSLGDILKKYSAIFSPELGKIKGYKAVVKPTPDLQPKVCKPRPVPFALKSAVEAELQRLLDEGVIEHVDSSVTPVDYVSPIVIVFKPSGAVRICADFKATINSGIYDEAHPLPRVEDILVNLTGGEQFSIIDLRDAYLQMKVEENSRQYLVISTHKGFYRYKRLPFGIKFAPKKFQKAIEQILAGLEGVNVLIDDIICTGKDLQQHLERLEALLDRLNKAGIKVKETKCKWLQNSVTYLGHTIDKTGVRPNEDHLKALKEMPIPTNVKQLRSFLGTINYYAKFIPNLQTKCVPLYRLIKKGIPWKWTQDDTDTVTELKNALSSESVLIHYDLSLPLILNTDASDVGIGAVLSHKLPNGDERPIAYASRTLSDTEYRYSAIDKEALGIVFGVTKFHQYLTGRHFVLKTDHKPLIRLFGPFNALPKTAANRISRWALTLSTYDYEILYCTGKTNVTADALSRLPLANEAITPKEKSGSPKSNQLLELRLNDLPVTRKVLRNETRRDNILSKVLCHIDRGWPQSKQQVTDVLKTYFEKRDELSFEEGILLWQGRIVVPASLRLSVMQMIHAGHPGVSAMRALVRFHVWWPQIDSSIDEFVKKCKHCQENRSQVPEAPLYSWSVPNDPWSRLHIDFAGPFEGGGSEDSDDEGQTTAGEAASNPVAEESPPVSENEEEQRLRIQISSSPLLAQAELSTSQSDFFKMLDEKINNGPDYDPPCEYEFAMDQAQLCRLLQEWQAAKLRSKCGLNESGAGRGAHKLQRYHSLQSNGELATGGPQRKLHHQMSTYAPPPPQYYPPPPPQYQYHHPAYHHPPPPPSHYQVAANSVVMYDKRGGYYTELA